jgi:hypothetical protein
MPVQYRLYRPAVLQMPKHLEDVRLAILTCPFEPPKPKTKHKVDISSAEQFESLRRQEQEYFRDMVQLCRDSGATLVICQWGELSCVCLCVWWGVLGGGGGVWHLPAAFPAFSPPSCSRIPSLSARGPLCETSSHSHLAPLPPACQALTTRPTTC